MEAMTSLMVIRWLPHWRASLHFLLLFLLLVLPLAGCLGTDTPHGEENNSYSSFPAVEVRRGEHCDSSVVANCRELEQDPHAPILIRGLELIHSDHKRGPNGPSIGLWVHDLDRGVRIEDSVFRGFRQDIRIENVACGSCTVHIQNITIEPESDGPPEDQHYGAIVIENSTLDVMIGDVVIRLPAKLMSDLNQRSNSGYGISIRDLTGHIQVIDTNITARERDGYMGIDLWTASTVEMKNVHLSGFEKACTQLVGVISLKVEGLSANKCNHGLHGQFGRPSGGEPPGPLVELKNVEISDVDEVGVILTSRSATCRPPTTREELGADRPSATLENLSVTRAGWLGLQLYFLIAGVKDSRFVENGHEWTPSTGVESYQTGGISNLCSELTLRDSVLENNHRYGVFNGPYDDLRDNWWGHPDGPTPDPYAPLPPPPTMFGDHLGPYFSNHIPFKSESHAPAGHDLAGFPKSEADPLKRISVRPVVSTTSSST